MRCERLHESGYLQIAQAGWDAGRHRANFVKAVLMLAREQDAAARLGFVDRLQHSRGDADILGFQVDVQKCIWKSDQHLYQSRDAQALAAEWKLRAIASECVPRVEALDLIERSLVDETAAATASREVGIVRHHDHPVARRVDIGLEVARADIDGGLERRHRVLRMRPRAAAMGKDTRP